MIPYLSLQQITAMHADEIQSAIHETVDGGWYLQGRNIAAFESEYAAYNGMQHCVTCANGLDALTLMLRAAILMGKMTEGDEVIVPANTYIATILAITENRLTPVLVEPRMETFQIDDRMIEGRITPRTKAIMLVNLYGYDAYTERIGELCREHGLLLFIDNAQGHGLKLPECTAVAHSFYPGKNLGALGDAGAVTTDDAALASTIRTVANYGSAEKYVFRYQGRNSRMDEIQAAALRVKLRYLDSDNERRRMIAQAYIDNISNPAVTMPPRDGVFHIFPVLCRERDALQRFLTDKGIGTMIHYPIPPHKQEAYREWNGLSLPVTERIHREELSLPCNPAMTDAEVEMVINAVTSFVS